MAAIKNYFKILGVEYDATDTQIREAHRKLAKKYHPDLNQGDATAGAKFRNVQEANDTLLDAEKRREHCVFLESKGIATGIFNRIEPEPEPVQEQPDPSAQKSAAAPAAPKRPLTRAEKYAATMQKVRDEKAKFRRTMMISLIAAGAAVVLGVSIALGVIFGTPKYTVTFDYGVTGQANISETVRKGGEVDAPELVQNNGLDFVGWFETKDNDESDESQALTFPYTPTKTITLYARWKEPPPRLSMDVTLHFMDGRIPATETVQVYMYERGRENVPSLSGQRLGYTFMGWYRFAADGGDFASSDPNPPSNSIQLPASSTSLATSLWGAETAVLYARWAINDISVIYRYKEDIDDDEYVSVGGGIGTVVPYTRQEGETIFSNIILVTPPNAQFIGWFLVPEQGDAVRVADENAVLLMDWREIENSHLPVTLYARYEPI